MKRLIFVISISILVSCNGNDDVPDGIIPMDKMTSVLIDYHISEQMVSKTILSYDSAKYLFHSKYYPKLLQEHKVTTEQFARSIEYYTKNIDQFQEVYQSVEDSLKIRYEAIKKDDQEEKADSVENSVK